MRTFWLTPLLLLIARGADACGGFMCSNSQPVLQAAEQILFAVDGDKVTTIVQVQYQGPPGAFSWVLPLPGVPTVGVSTDAVFTQLRAGTDPTFYLHELSTPGCRFNDCPPIDWTDGSDGSDSVDGTDGSEATDGGEEPPVEILGQGAVGPYDYTIITSESGASLYEWLLENGYDQPTTATPVIEHYAALGYPLVAVKLQSTSDVGDIVPIALEYTSPTFACVPLRLTSVASAPNLPVRVWILGEARAVPLNYFHVTVNAKLLPWSSCTSAISSIWCGIAYENAARAAVDAAGGRAFVTDAAGPTKALVLPLGPIPLDTENVGLLADTIGDWYLFHAARVAVGSQAEALRIWQQVLPMNPTVVSGPCAEPSKFYGDDFDECVAEHFGESWILDYGALAAAFGVAANAPRLAYDALIESHPYITRLYTQISADEMTLDPLFSFNPDLGRVAPARWLPYRPVCAPGKDTTNLAQISWPNGTIDHVGTGCGGQLWTSPQNQPAWGSIQVMNESGPATQLGTDEIATHAPVVALRAPSLGQSLLPVAPFALLEFDDVSGGLSASTVPLANAVDPETWFAAQQDEPNDGAAVDGSSDGASDGAEGAIDGVDGSVDGADDAVDGSEFPVDGEEPNDPDSDVGSREHSEDDVSRPRPDSATPDRVGDAHDEAAKTVDGDGTGCTSGPVAVDPHAGAPLLLFLWLWARRPRQRRPDAVA